MSLTVKQLKFDELFDLGFRSTSYFEDREIAKYGFEYTQEEDCSFVVFEEKEAVLFVPATRKDHRYSFHGWPIRPMLVKKFDEKKGAKALDCLLKHWIEAEKSTCLLAFSSMAAQSALKYECAVKSQLFSRVNLQLSEEKLRMNLRASFKSLVNQGKRDLVTRIDYGADVPYSVIEQAMNFHILISGRRTRSEATWKIQHDLILKKKAFLVSSYYQDSLAASSYINTDGHEAYYGSGVYDRKLMAEGVPLAHWNMFRAFLFAKEMGNQSFLLGEAHPSLWSDAKYRDVCKFKRGFGGEIELIGSLEVSGKNEN